MNENNKKALALATVVSFVISNPITGYAQEMVASAVDVNKNSNTAQEKKKEKKNYETDDAYHGTWEKPFIFPEDKDEELNPSGGGFGYVSYSSNRRGFKSASYGNWKNGGGSYNKYKTYNESKKINKGKSSIRNSSSGSSGKSTGSSSSGSGTSS